ncbi:hypothetical protein [Falsiroseomonas sp.]|uniref:hypothetical protein n=1 Tax=Falsiroseomonas sp. TaxID=2870721 RepID=UPI002732E577|nr:hypothetical protein [Falsiroseomonas sp.]MDP3417874.1 hypothetical protein [Falsiroseomonas sp.]
MAGAILNADAVSELRAMFRDGVPRQHIANQFGVAVPTVYAIASGRLWKHIDEDRPHDMARAA